MWFMSDYMTDAPRQDARVSFRVPRQMSGRIDVLAAYSGHGRSEFIRTAVELADAMMSLASLQRAGSLTSEQEHAKRAIRRRLAAIEEVLAPTTLD